MSVDHTHNLIELHDVSFAYGNDKVISHTNFAIHQGDYIGVIGPNGGGKTTLIRLILGLLQPTTGYISIYGTKLSQFRQWSKLGYVSQQASRQIDYFPITVKEVVMLGRYQKLGPFQQPSRQDHKAVDAALKQVEMGEFANRLIGELSGGQQQRVMIARALAGQPEIILLDEPTTGIDTRSQEQFYKLLRKLNRELNLTLILATHEVDVVAREATEVVYVNHSLTYHADPKTFVTTVYNKLSKGEHA